MYNIDWIFSFFFPRFFFGQRPWIPISNETWLLVRNLDIFFRVNKPVTTKEATGTCNSTDWLTSRCLLIGQEKKERKNQRSQIDCEVGGWKRQTTGGIYTPTIKLVDIFLGFVAYLNWTITKILKTTFCSSNSSYFRNEEMFKMKATDSNYKMGRWNSISVGQSVILFHWVSGYNSTDIVLINNNLLVGGSAPGRPGLTLAA